MCITHCPSKTYELCLKYELFYSLNFGQVTDGQTDRQKVMPMSKRCISTGVLKMYILINANFIMQYSQMS